VILDWVKTLGEQLLRIWPLRIVPVYEHAVRLRWGKDPTPLAPGLRWIWPYADAVLTVSRAWETERTSPQSVTTAEGTSWVLSLTAAWYVSDGPRYLIQVSNQEGKGAVLDCLAGAACTVVEADTGETPRRLERKIRLLANWRGAEWGIKFDRIRFADRVKGRTLRLVTEHPVQVSQ
jgi:regulator of protease activity HflC (stomatin/prohibitin superfamily)